MSPWKHIGFSDYLMNEIKMNSLKQQLRRWVLVLGALESIPATCGPAQQYEAVFV